MYYEERYINGLWQYRTTPTGDWHELYPEKAIRAIQIQIAFLHLVQDVPMNKILKIIVDNPYLSI